MTGWHHRRHPSVSVHPKSRLSDILAHMQTRGRQACSGSSRCSGIVGDLAPLLRPGVEQAHSDVADAWEQILDDRYSGRSRQC